MLGYRPAVLPATTALGPPDQDPFWCFLPEIWKCDVLQWINTGQVVYIQMVRQRIISSVNMHEYITFFRNKNLKKRRYKKFMLKICCYYVYILISFILELRFFLEWRRFLSYVSRYYLGAISGAIDKTGFVCIPYKFCQWYLNGIHPCLLRCMR